MQTHWTLLSVDKYSPFPGMGGEVGCSKACLHSNNSYVKVTYFEVAYCEFHLVYLLLHKEETP